MLSTTKWIGRIPWLLIPVLLLSCSIAKAQNITATLSGIATDQTDARIAGATILVRNEASGDKRDTKTDNQGFWSVTALIPGSYSVTITAKGFSPWEENQIVLNQGDSRTVANIHLKIGAADAAVTVISGADAEVPVDTAEVSATLNNELVDSAILTGRDAAELIKLMPGVTFNNGGSAGSAFNSQTTGTNNGPAGNFSANGTQPYGSTALMLDGAMLVDPGNAGTQIANINQDMTDSVKFMSASYGAEYAKGPAVLQAFSKSGGQKFHGEGYFYARNNAIGFAEDWFAKSVGAVVNPEYFYYVGGNVGGPISLFNFNKNKDKLFFWVGYEKMIQHPYNSPQEMNVPTSTGDPEMGTNPGQVQGDFNNIGINSSVISNYGDAYRLPCTYGDNRQANPTATPPVTFAYGQGCNPAITPWEGWQSSTGTGAVPNLKQYFDPNGIIVSGLNPTGNQVPTSANGWNNYNYVPNTPQDRWEVTGKVNYSLNDNNKIWGSYTTQIENDNHPISIWWAPSGTIPYPGKPVGVETAHVYLANYTHVFSASTTNEFVFAYAEFINNTSLSDPAAVSRKALGFPVGSLFGASHQVDSIPDFEGGWEDGVTWIGDSGQNQYDGGLYGPNSFGKTAKAPNISDTFTKIVGTHSIKAGFYWDTQENVQSSGGDINGTFNASGGPESTYNYALDRLMGRNNSYNEQSNAPNIDAQWHQWSIWGQDSWKINRKITLNYGLRLDHMGQWYDPTGSQVWDPATYSNVLNGPANTGIQWHSLLSSVPLSGWGSKLFTYNPRLGVAYDVFGTGKTVVRGGFGIYQYQVSGNDGTNAMGGPVGSFNFSTNNGSTGVQGFQGYNIANGLVPAINAAGNAFVASQITVPTGTAENGGNISADKLGDSQIPYADTWSFGVAQALPSHTVAEVSYVGSASRNQLENGGNGHISDANPVALGAFFAPDPRTGMLATAEPGSGGPNSNDYRALVNYDDIYILTHGGFANYNSLQVSAQKQSGNLYLFTNFTFGKVLGTRDGNSSNGNGNGPAINPFNLGSNYGQLEYDHTKTFNLSFSYKLPKPIHSNWLAGEVINGWQLSGYTTYEDGAPYQATSNGNMNTQYSGLSNNPALPKGTSNQQFTTPGGWTSQNIDPATWEGTNQPENGVQPVLVCDPRKGTGKGQYFNPNCFVSPMGPTATSNGQMGQIIWPYIRAPHYVGSDLAIFKAFRVTDAQRIEARISATNWLNHPNGQFGQNGNSDNQLQFYGASTGAGLVYNHNASTTGVPSTKSGYRWLQFAAKYYF
jgi:hypothetical protein